MTLVRGCASMHPPVSRGAPCTRCHKGPQAAVQMALAATLPLEQLSRCSTCRSNAKKTIARNLQALELRRPGQTHCACGTKLGTKYAKCSACRRDA